MMPWLVVDDAHGFGVLGREGRGSLDHAGLSFSPRLVYVGTLGKAAGVSGAFVAGVGNRHRVAHAAFTLLHFHDGDQPGHGFRDSGIARTDQKQR